MKVSLSINKVNKVLEVDPGEFLLDSLRKANYLSVRRGCDTTNCGVCTVLLDGKPVASCSVLTAKADGHEITTVEGIQAEAHKIGGYLGEEGADQCGFCNPALALTVYAMKQKLYDPTEDEVRQFLVGNLCRCTGYIQQERGIMKYLGDKS